VIDREHEVVPERPGGICGRDHTGHGAQVRARRGQRRVVVDGRLAEADAVEGPDDRRDHRGDAERLGGSLVRADVVGAALGALAGPLHGGAPSRALDALDAIGDPANTEAWVEAEVAAGRRIMGFGHAVYRTRDPRSALLREVALGIGGELVDQAVDVERRVLATLARLKPDHPLPSNVEFYAGVVMAAAGLPRALFTPTFAVSRSIGWVTHACEQAAIGKLIRPSARYVGPHPSV